MKENRYFQMIYLLLEKGQMTAPELADYFEVSIRTIYRDIDILSSAGIPIYATQGKGGGIAIQDSYVLKKSLLSEQEQKQILMALQGIRVLEDEQINMLLSKLSGVFQRQQGTWLEIDFSTWTKSGAGKHNFQLLQSAIWKSRIVSFSYYSGKGEQTKRIIEPHKLVFKTSDWYLYGYCTLRKDFRFFKLTRIRDLKLQDAEFMRETPEHIFERSDEFEMKTVQVTLLFDAGMSHEVYEKFDEEVSEQADGSLLVTTILPDNELLYSYVLSCRERVEVLSPPYVRDNVRKRVRKMLEIYKT
ncbi:DeoR faimly transcriptional regulator [[Clostridium] innocuum]|uniref:DeoR faimly transcriptional regulator n=1 Tax=Clostridium innocuum TaxID=1522 RepID=A0A099I6R3_CLOIN|nr:YafY family protein [[Clostridium] innocuum]KGJ53261.1 DeoR faimly transcriptional regulator [[Clostridium] innocuum]